MKWLTRAWATGELKDDEFDERWRLYEAHRAEVLPRLSRGAERLIEGINLHDAQVRTFDYSPHQMLTMRALIGDLQVGYEFIELDYLEAELRLENTTIDSLSLFDTGTEIIYDEVDVGQDGRFVHRVLLWPEGEYEVLFTGLIERRLPATPADRN